MDIRFPVFGERRDPDVPADIVHHPVVTVVFTRVALKEIMDLVDGARERDEVVDAVEAKLCVEGVLGVDRAVDAPQFEQAIIRDRGSQAMPYDDDAAAAGVAKDVA